MPEILKNPRATQFTMPKTYRAEFSRNIHGRTKPRWRHVKSYMYTTPFHSLQNTCICNVTWKNESKKKISMWHTNTRWRHTISCTYTAPFRSPKEVWMSHVTCLNELCHAHIIKKKLRGHEHKMAPRNILQVHHTILQPTELLNESCYTYEWVKAKQSIWRHMDFFFRKKVCLENIRWRHAISCPWHHSTHEWVMLHVWTSHVTRMDESCHTYECVVSHVWISHITCMHESTK